MELEVVGGVDVTAEGEAGDLDVEGGGHEDVSGGEVVVGVVVVGEVGHGLGNLDEDGEVLGRGEGRDGVDWVVHGEEKGNCLRLPL